MIDLELIKDDIISEIKAISDEEWSEIVAKMEKESDERYYNSPKVKEFYECLKKWDEEVGHFSNTHTLISNRHFLRIIGIGRYLYDVVMKELPDDWFLAIVLEAWSGTTPPKDLKQKELIQWWQDYFKDDNNYCLFMEQDDVMY